MADESRVRWSRSAAGWDAHADAMSREAMPVSSWMVEAVGPQPGHDLLELAAGPGDVGFLAAELIQPGGTLITSDLVPEMLTVAQRRAEALGLRNVRFKQMDARLPLDLAAASLDGVLCRWGYMLLDDPEAALRETRRVLRPGARVALAAWTGPDDNLWSAIPVRELIARGRMERLDPDAPGQFAWAREGRIAEVLEAAGFDDPVVEAIAFTRSFRSVEDWWETTRALSTRVADARVAPEEIVPALREAAAPFLAPDGSLAIPARSWVAAATA